MYEHNSINGRRSSTEIDTALLVLRLFTGVIFFMHGWQKLVDNGISATQAGFDAMGAPIPDVTAVLATGLELVGGAALILGVFTRLFGLLLAFDMLSAYVIVHKDLGIFVANGGYELVAMLGAGAVTLAIAGGGAWSLDAMLNLPRRVGLAGRSSTLASSRF